jgi:uncharacterized membrane protein YoaK (UPF0700 family)
MSHARAGLAGMSEVAVRDGLLLALTFLAGSVDVIGYVALGRVFTANMTGNLVLLGISAGQGQPPLALRSTVALVGFALGALIAGRITGGQAATAAIWPARVTLALWAEMVLLGAFLVGWRLSDAGTSPGAVEPLLAVSAAAMGVQSAAARQLAVSNVSTTYVTGTLTSLMTELAALSAPAGWRRWLQVLAALLVGAVVGAVALSVWQDWAPVVPTGLLVGVVVLAAIRFPEATPEAGYEEMVHAPPPKHL